jgi:hypothetical protein
MRDQQLRNAGWRVFEDLLKIPEGSRPAFLDSACSADLELREYVLELIAEFQKASDAISFPVALKYLQSPTRVHSEFRGNARFEFLRQVGSGGFASVFHAWDRERHASVALKLLHNWSPKALIRFKKEFRTLKNLSHPNLVQLHQLFSEDSQWFFTMEFIEGTSFLEYVRPSGAKCDFDRLRAALSQLITGVNVLHEANCIHRDLKPANVMVDGRGRVIILDFGLVREVGLTPVIQTASLVGTPAYMSPEQVVNSDITQASDWYSVGVMLFEAFTGRLPYEGGLIQVLMAKQHQDAPRPSEYTPSVPKDLDDLCHCLLARDPKLRRQPEILMATSTKANGAIRQFEQADDLFVGRDREVSVLQAGFGETQNGRLFVGLVNGRSGMGKTTLVEHFLQSIVSIDPAVLILKGRCYQSESVPYKAIDALIDELSRYLGMLPMGESNALLPRDIWPLTRAFPVFGQVKSINESVSLGKEIFDAQEIRHRAFAALSELLARVADRKRLVLWIDDFQWGDEDSMPFLQQLLSTQQPPALMIVLSFRSEDRAGSVALKAMDSALAERGSRVILREIPVAELPAPDLQALSEALAPGAVEAGLLLVRESRGNPLFLRELAKYWHQLQNNDGVEPESKLSLRKMILCRFARLSTGASQFVKVISLAARPLRPQIVIAAAGTDESETVVRECLDERVIRICGSDSTQIVIYHDEIREAVVETLSPQERRVIHASLAAILAREDGVDPEVLVTHYQGAQEFHAAFEKAVQAARVARQLLAFDRTVRLLEFALSLNEVTGDEQADLLAKLGEALSMCGRGKEAADHYAKAASLVMDQEKRRALALLACSQLIRAGYIDLGIQSLRNLLLQCGISVPNMHTELFARLILLRLFLWLRQCAKFNLGRLISRPSNLVGDALLVGASYLTAVCPLLSAYCLTRALLWAEQMPNDRERLSMLLSAESGFQAIRGPRAYDRAMRISERAHELAIGAGSDHALGLNLLFRSFVCFLAGKPLDNFKNSCEAERIFRNRCAGVSWEIATAKALQICSLGWTGQANEYVFQVSEIVREARSRSDVYAETSIKLIAWSYLASLFLDDPDEASEEIRSSLNTWNRQEFDLQKYSAVYGLVETSLYKGDCRQAEDLLRAHWQDFSHSLLFQWQILKIMFLHLRGRAALLSLGSSAQSEKQVSYCIRQLTRTGSQWALAASASLEAGLAWWRWDRETSVTRLQIAEDRFEQVGLLLYAVGCRLRRGEACGNSELIDQADGWMRERGVKNPRSMTRLLLPWYPHD